VREGSSSTPTPLVCIGRTDAAALPGSSGAAVLAASRPATHNTPQLQGNSLQGNTHKVGPTQGREAPNSRVWCGSGPATAHPPWRHTTPHNRYCNQQTPPGSSAQPPGGRHTAAGGPPGQPPAASIQRGNSTGSTQLPQGTCHATDNERFLIGCSVSGPHGGGLALGRLKPHAPHAGHQPLPTKGPALSTTTSNRGEASPLAAQAQGPGQGPFLETR
jgi:hypothetical protein